MKKPVGSAWKPFPAWATHNEQHGGEKLGPEKVGGVEMALRGFMR